MRGIYSIIMGSTTNSMRHPVTYYNLMFIPIFQPSKQGAAKPARLAKPTSTLRHNAQLSIKRTGPTSKGKRTEPETKGSNCTQADALGQLNIGGVDSTATV